MNAAKVHVCAGDLSSRQRLMRACAMATEVELADAIAELGEPPVFQEIRPAHTGLVMLRGRIGGSGPAFNLGEATVTRAAVRLDDGSIGFSYLIGRCHHRARLAALADALGQHADFRARLENSLVAPVLARCAAADARAHAETAATKVDFLTLVRGED
jgi:alpha-D-ribose 1-methylphosphonate 5-triphosphate synthase subunit PhnG